MRVTGYMRGPSLCGFHGLSESDYGDPETPAPYPVAHPRVASGVVCPFPCPQCGAVVDFSDPRRREAYHDTREQRDARGRLIVKHNNYYCPACNKRFRLSMSGGAKSMGIIDRIRHWFGSGSGHAGGVAALAGHAHGIALLGAQVAQKRPAQRPMAALPAPRKNAPRPVLRAPGKATPASVAAKAKIAIIKGQRAVAAGKYAAAHGKPAEGRMAVATGQRAIASGSAALRTSVRGEDEFEPFEGDETPEAEPEAADGPVIDPFSEDESGMPNLDPMSAMPDWMDAQNPFATSSMLDDMERSPLSDSAMPESGGSDAPLDFGSGGGASPDFGSGYGGGGGTEPIVDPVQAAADAEAAEAELRAEIAAMTGAGSNRS